jgi:hypothetical protein
MYLKQRSIYYQQWNKTDIILSLKNIPGGEAALTIIPTLYTKTFDKVINELEKRNICQSTNLLMKPQFMNKYIHFILFKI